MAIGALIAFAFWLFIALPLYYGQRDYSAAQQCSGQENRNYGFWEKARCDPIAYFTIWLVGFTGVLAASTIGLWIVTWQSGKRQSRDMETAVMETRRIGQAQIRAYVDITTAKITFGALLGTPNSEKHAHPAITIVATNTGQSPARNFVWNPTLQYIYTAGNDRRTLIRELGANWRDILGVGIPVGGNHLDSAMIQEMNLNRFVPHMDVTELPPNQNVLVRLRIQFEFDDVFDNRIPGDAYFAGIFSRMALIGVAEPSDWSGSISRMHKPNDWPELPNHSKQA